MAGSKSMQPMDAIKHLERVLQTLAPVRGPQILPRGCTYGVDMLHKVCITEKQRNALEKYIQQLGESTLQVIGTFDADSMCYRIERLERMDENDRELHQLHYVMEIARSDPQRSSEILQHFLKRNGYKSTDRVIAQQCWSAAFALQVAVRYVDDMNSVHRVSHLL